MPGRITPTQGKVLRSLARYKFLTNSQLARLGVFKNAPRASKVMSELREGKDALVDLRETGQHLEVVYYIKYDKAAQIIAEHLDLGLKEIKYPKSKPTLSYDSYRHRKMAIDCQIELYSYCQEEGIGIEFYDRDIDRTGNVRKDNNLTKRTSVTLPDGRNLEPDANFLLDTQIGKKLYCLEYERRDNRTKSDLIEKFDKHLRALNAGLISKKYGHPKAHRVLFVFEHPNVMEWAMEEASKIGQLDNWFLFKTYADVVNEVRREGNNYVFETTQHYFHNWRNSRGELVSIF